MRAWRIIRSDRMLFASAVAAVVLVFAIVFGPPILAKILGHGSDTPLPYATDPITRRPVGPFTSVWNTTREYTDDTGYVRKEPPPRNGQDVPGRRRGRHARSRRAAAAARGGPRVA